MTHSEGVGEGQGAGEGAKRRRLKASEQIRREWERRGWWGMEWGDGCTEDREEGQRERVEGYGNGE